MGTDKLLVEVLLLVSIEALVMSNSTNNRTGLVKMEMDQDLDTVFNGVYSECILYMSYSCLQNKTLLYLKELNNLSEISIIGDYVKFVKLNITKANDGIEDEKSPERDSDELAYLIDKAVDRFFDNHVIKFSGIERQISMSNNVEEFVGRKKRKGGGGGHGGHDGDDGGKKKMMMMAMMCMKMKLMMMVPAMMGMMGMMSFKGMMFSMMSFVVSKMMLLMKILEKKGGAGGAGGGLGGVGVGDGGWPAAGGGGAWMPAGGQDYAGTAGGGYDANGQWQSRSLLEKEDREAGNDNNQPMRSRIDNKPYSDSKRSKYSVNDDTIKLKRNKRSEINSVKYERIDNEAYSNDGRLKGNFKEDALDFNRIKSTIDSNKYISIDNGPYLDAIRLTDVVNENAMKPKLNKISTLGGFKKHARNKRSIIDTIQNAYVYWMNRFLGLNNNRRANKIPKYRIANGVKYIYYPFRQNFKATKQINLSHGNKLKNVNDGFKVANAEDFNKGEIIEGGAESRMNRKKFHKMKEAVNDTIDDNPWE